MKRIVIILISVFAIIAFHANAANRYWVGGTGSWNNVNHWSTISGGVGGATIPTTNDDVIFDKHSFQSSNQVVQILTNAYCHSIDFSAISQKAILAGNSISKLDVSGNFILSNNVINGFKGAVVFTSSSQNTIINTYNKTLEGKFVFNGTGSWKLAGDIEGTISSEIILEKGKLFTNDKKIKIGKVVSSGNNIKSLDLGTSEVNVLGIWDLSVNTNLSCSGLSARLIYEEQVTLVNYKSGNFQYGSVSTRAGACGTPPVACAAFTISLSGTNVTCNGDQDGTATATITGGSGNYTYLWTPAPGGGQGTPNATGLGSNTYIITVHDNVLQGVGVNCFCQISISEPAPLIAFELSNTSPSCNGGNDGTADVSQVGGTPNYSYLWAPAPGGGQGTASATGLSAQTYTVTITDNNGCTASTLIAITQPTVLSVPGSFTNVLCNGNCNGTASVVASGGTTPYTYAWLPAPGAGQGTANATGLCPNTYTCTVTDFNGCTASYTATINEPLPLTSVGSQTNASCGGVCDGTATITIAGGTSTYNYVWSSGPGPTNNTASLTNTGSALCAGGYTVTVTDAGGCTTSQSYLITQPVTLTALATATDVSCNGGSDGTATVVTGGGTLPFTYNWTPGNPVGDGTATITNLSAGTYTVDVGDVNGCTATATVTVNEPTALSAVASAIDITCNGLCDGSATAAPTGGVPPYSYSWAAGGQITQTITNLCAGTYTVTVTDANLCTSTQAVTVIEPTAISLPITSANVTCNGNCDGTASAAPSGGVPPYTYLWAPAPGAGQGSANVTGLCPATYTVTVTDNSGCTQSNTITIIQPNLLSISASNTALLCNLDCNSTISTVVAGGTPPYTYLWVPGGQSSASLTNQCAGSYTVTVTMLGGCTASTTLTITQPTALNLATNTTDVTCFAACDGTLGSLAGGGTAPYTYLWQPGGQTTSSINGQCAGTYTITATDLNGCTIADTLTITEPPILSANPSVVSNVSCSGGSDGSATAAPSGGTGPYTYDWSPGAPTGDGTPTITGLTAGTYSVLVTDAHGCTSSQSVTVTQPSVLTASITGSTSSCNICNGTATAAGAGGVAPYTYLWSPSNQATPTATGLCPGVTYTCTVTGVGGCTATTTVTIIQAVTIIVTTSNTTLSCNGSCNGVITANAVGGTPPYSYLWTAAGFPGQGTPTYSSLCAGTYTVNVSDVVGCFSTATVTFVNPPVLTTTSSKTDVTCGGALCDGTATASPVGGTPPYSYSWNSIPSQASQTATGLCAGTYTCTVTDNNGCTATTSITITQPTIVDDNENLTLPTCTLSDGLIFVSPTGGSSPYSYNWGPGNPAGQGTNLISNLAAGIYTLDITDNAGCVFSFSYLLSNFLVPSTTISHTDITCNGLCDGTITVVASGGTPPYTYSWLPSGQVGDFTPSISVLCAGTYTVQVTDFMGCIKFDTDTIVEPAIINPNGVIVNESCGGACNGSITTAVTGGVGPFTYVWSPGTGTGQGTSTYTNLCSGTYTVDITDANGCTSSTTYTITGPASLSVTLASTNVTCNAACDGTATATIVGGTSPYTHSWSFNGIINGAWVLPNIVTLCPGTYIDSVTDANGCTALDTVIITEPTALTVITSQTNITCFGLCDGIASVAVAGGTSPYTYLWNPNAAITDTIISLCAGAYIATITDANGCPLIAPTITITSPTQISPNVTSTNPLCNGNCNGTATAAPTGGTGSSYTYVWTPLPLPTTPSITNLCAGTYAVDVTDSLGCTVNQSVTLTDPSVLSANLSSTSPLCANGCNGTVTATPIGGTPGYTYSWSPGVAATTATVSNLCPNIYTAIVTDTNGCADTQTVVLNNTLPIDAAISTTTATCGLADGTASVNPITGVGPYTYVWVPAPGAGQGTPNGTGMAAGIYNVTVTDVSGCDSTFSFAISNANGPTGTVDTVNHVTCFGACTGSAAILSVIGGTAPYSFLWNNAPANTANDTALNLCAGNYLVQITDANGCIYFAPITVTEPNQMIPNATIIDATCTNICDGSITVVTTGGTGAYTYSWAPGNPTGQGTSTITNLCVGSYTLTTTDGNNCVQLDTFIIGQSNPITATATSSLIYCAGACNGTSYITITTGSSPFIYQWNDPLNQTNDTASALCAGIYSVTITDSIGCISTITATVNEKPALAANPTITNATCGLCDGQAVVVPTGGTSPYVYAWSNGPIIPTSTNLCAGLYSVNITDSAGCTTNASIIINNTNGPTGVAVTSTNVSCNALCNGAVTAVVPVGGTAPYTYLWIQSGLTTPTVSNLCAGTYYLQISDALGCSYLDSVIITEPSPLLANQIVVSPTCNTSNGSIVIVPSGGSGTYTYVWNPGGSTNDTLLNLTAGVYTVVITDNSGCSQTIVIPLNSQNAPTLSVSNTDVTCNGSCNGTATVVATNGTPAYTYLWSAAAQVTPIATALCAGTYFVTVTDAAGCVAIANTTIIEPDTITFSLPDVNDPLCNADTNGNITVIPIGGTFPYSYSWTTIPVQTGATASNLGAGSYTVTITDVNGCTATSTFVLTNPPVLSITSLVTNPSCSTIADGAIDITVIGGTQPYAYQWSGGSSATTEDLTGLLAGTDTITVTDANGCIIKDTLTLIPTTFVLADAGNDTSFCQPGPITLDASGSTNGVNYQWFLIVTGGTNISAGTTAVVSVSPPTGTNTYYVLVDNGLGCSDTDTVTVTAFPIPSVDAGTNVTIFPGTTTTIGGNPTGPVGATYLWIPLPNLDNSTIANPVASPAVTTTFTVTVTSVDGCSASDTITVTISPQIVPVNGFSPNGDGVNDEWIIPNIEQYPDCVVEVYNRWGELLFQSPGYKEHWKGTFKGKPLPVGTYYFVINLNDPLYPDPYTGPITILR